MIPMRIVGCSKSGAAVSGISSFPSIRILLPELGNLAGFRRISTGIANSSSDRPSDIFSLSVCCSRIGSSTIRARATPPCFELS
jgi:hypothetical protein